MSARPVQNAEESRKGLTMKTSTEQQTPSQRAMSDVDRAAEAIWRADSFRMGDPDNWTGEGDQNVYRTMAVAAIAALGVTEEQYRSAMCPDDQPALFVKPPKMAHGDADRMADFSASVGLPLVPWQQDFLNRLESASMDEQFGEIVREMEQR